MSETKGYLAARTLQEAAQVAADVNPTILAGGTDLHPRWEREVIQWPTTILDIKAIDELNGIALANGEVSIGACTLMSELEVDPIVRGSAPLLADAASRLACPQIRNRATLGGNLCNASPAADTAVPLILLDAVLELASVHGGQVAKREVPIAEFFRGPGATTLACGEILTRIRFNALPGDWFRAWDKFGTRPAMEIAVASVGLVLACEDGVVTHARVGYGSVAPVPMRGRQAEAELVGNPISERVIKACVTAARKEIAPLTDVRATAAYRREIVGVMLTRMLNDADRARED